MSGAPSAYAGRASAQPPGISASTRYFPEIEGLRGIAITLVIAYHAVRIFDPGSRWQPGVIVSPLSAFAYAGFTGVSLFFILSAFLLSLPFLDTTPSEPIHHRRYYTRRALRILPLYWTAVAVATVACARRPADLLRGLPYVFFLNGVRVTAPLEPYSGVWWSLATEVQSYLALPLLGLLAGRGALRAGASLVLAIVGVAYIAFITHHLHVNDLAGQLLLSDSLVGRAPLFAAGILLAWIHSRFGSRWRLRWARVTWLAHGGADVLLAVTLGAFGYLLRHFVFAGYFHVQCAQPAWLFLEAVAWGAVVLLLLVAPLRTRWLWSNRVWQRLGILSYSLYLVHLPLVVWIAHLLGGRAGTLGWSLGGGVLLTLFSIALSNATYRVVERPFLVRKVTLGR